MGHWIFDKLPAITGRYAAIAGEQPSLLAAFAILLLAGVLAAIVAILRGRAREAYWWTVGVIVADFALSWGDDTYTHVFRIAAIADQLRGGAPSLMLVDPAGGEVLPTFVYYSLVPYILPVLLDLAGLPAMLAFKAVGALQFVVMALGLSALIERTVPESRDGGRSEHLVALLFVSAGYVYALWCTRAALAEFWVASLIPWAARYLVVANGQRMLVMLFALQAAAHPIVLLHGLVGEFLVAYGLARTPLLEMIRRAGGPLLLALSLASPFWLPQFLWQDLILGPAGLPARFADTFLTAGELVDPRSVRSIGIWLPLGLLAVLLTARLRLSARFWLLTSAALATVAIETVYLRPVAVHLPLLSLSLFVWRLSIPAAFLAFGALLVGVREAPAPRFDPLAPLAILSVLAMAWVMASLAPAYLRKLAVSGDDAFARAQHHDSRPVWGVREFLPNYARVATLCPPETEVEVVSYEALRAGVTSQRAFLAVPRAPLGIVDYLAGAISLAPAACGDNLMLGPVAPGTRLRVGERWLDGLLLIRLLSLLVIVLLPLARPASARVSV
jgi:hypothetical protein